jgi:hypothetical protein
MLKSGVIIYCPKCDAYCGDIYFGILYKFGKANLNGKCECGYNINEEIKKKENF